ncbi:hypothetical protein HOG48_03060 [Candidatus Peregrinibacteria bacterium]|jgi:hypothetical protein|nr:hypothetical protein [Candidatus Peregrinibacteria bacterium]
MIDLDELPELRLEDVEEDLGTMPEEQFHAIAKLFEVEADVQEILEAMRTYRARVIELDEDILHDGHCSEMPLEQQLSGCYSYFGGELRKGNEGDLERQRDLMEELTLEEWVRIKLLETLDKNNPDTYQQLFAHTILLPGKRKQKDGIRHTLPKTGNDIIKEPLELAMTFIPEKVNFLKNIESAIARSIQAFRRMGHAKHMTNEQIDKKIQNLIDPFGQSPTPPSRGGKYQLKLL